MEMITIMKKGILVLGLIYIVTIICWFITPPISEISFINQISQCMGALALVGFAYMGFISTRHNLVDELFNGLDKAYVAHKWLGIGSIGLVIVHLVLLGVDRANSAVVVESTAKIPGGAISLLLFVVLILIAILAKKMDYENWKTVHKFMAIPYAVGLLHYYNASSYELFGFSSFSIWMNLINLIGMASIVYSIFIYEITAFPFRYTVSDIKHVSKETLQITGKASGKSILFKPGQFTFLKFPKIEKKFTSHPFTMSEEPQAGMLQFTIKNLGDHTSMLIKTIKPGDEFVVTPPHGMFDYTKGEKHQIWIAGGIGITPFRSFYRAGIPPEFSIDFFYSYRGMEEGVYLDEMRALQENNLRLHLIDSTEQGRLTVEKIKEHITTESPVDIYFCGPKIMRDSLQKEFKSSGIPVLGFHFEEFQFK